MGTKLESGDRVIAYLVGTDGRPVIYAALEAAVAGDATAKPFGLSPLDLPELQDSGFGVVFGGVPFSIIRVPTALPRPEWELGVRANIAWPTAIESALGHSEHVIVAPIEDVTDRRDGLRKAVLTSLLSALIARTRATTAICWQPSGTFVEAAHFISATADLVSGSELGALPLDSWMRVDMGRMEGRYAAIARGLVPLVGVDLAVLNDRPDPVGQASTLYSLAGYLVREGVTLSDKDTLELGGQQMAASLSPDGLMMWIEPARLPVKAETYLARTKPVFGKKV